MKIKISDFPEPLQKFATWVDNTIGDKSGDLDRDEVSQAYLHGPFDRFAERSALDDVWRKMSAAQEKTACRARDQQILADLKPLLKKYPSPFSDAGKDIVGNNFGQPQVYSVAEEDQFFHPGVDFLKKPGTAVHAVAGGYVQFLKVDHMPPEWRDHCVMIFDPKTKVLFGYGHLEPGSIPKEIEEAVRLRTQIPAGAVLGKVRKWPVGDFHHLHFSVAVPPDSAVKDLIGSDMSFSEVGQLNYNPETRYFNPLLFLKPKGKDSLPPAIHEIILRDDQDQTLSEAKPVRGRIHLIANIGDQQTASGRNLAPQSLGYEIEELTGDKSHHVPYRQLVDFSALPVVARRDNMDQLVLVDPTPGSPSTTGPYDPPSMYFRLSHSPDGSGPNGWDTAALDGKGLPQFPDGTYRITVVAKDLDGNESRKSVDLEVKNHKKV